MFTATTCSAAIQGLLNSFRRHLHKTPIKIPTFLNLATPKYACEPTTINKNFYPQYLNNFLEFHRNSLVSAIPFTQTATAKVQTTPKVKLLCSFGGKFMPQRSDGKLRYLGGQSRVIAIRRDTTFQSFYCKMQDIYGGPVRIYYKLPHESLDTLAPVYSIEDFENMMQETDNLSNASKCGCPKLWLFLFPPFDLEEFINEGNNNISALEHQKFSAHYNVADMRNVSNQHDEDIRRRLMHQQRQGFTTYDQSLKRLRSQLSNIFKTTHK